MPVDATELRRRIGLRPSALHIATDDSNTHATVTVMPITEAQFESLREDVKELQQQYAVREETLRTIDKRLTGIESLLSRMNWLIISGIGVALLAFILGGGLNLPVH